MDDLITRVRAAIEKTIQAGRITGAEPIQDSQSALRRCEADLRTLDRHEPHGPEWLKCTWCGEDWPCPDVLDRANAYGLPEGRQPSQFVASGRDLTPEEAEDFKRAIDESMTRPMRYSLLSGLPARPAVSDPFAVDEEG